MKYDIHQLAVVPYIIAERAAWNVLESDKRYKDHTPQQIAAMVEDIGPKLVAKSEHIYQNNRHFRKQLNNPRKDQRFVLEMFMEHWAMAIIQKPQAETVGKTQILPNQ